METFYNDLLSQASAFFNTYTNLTYVIGALLVIYMVISFFSGSAARKRVAAVKSENAQAIASLQTALDGKVNAALKQLQAETANAARAAQSNAQQFQQVTNEIQKTRQQAEAAEAARTAQVENVLGQFNQALEAAKLSIAKDAQNIFNAKAGSLMDASTAQGRAVEQQAAALRTEFSDKLKSLSATTATREESEALVALTSRVDTLHQAIDEMARALERMGRPV